MTCSECQERIFEGELTPDARAHVAECAECGEWAEEARLNAAVLAGMRDEVMPVPVAAKRVWPKYAGLAAAAMVAVAVGLHSDKPLIPEPKPPRFTGVPQVAEIVPSGARAVKVIPKHRPVVKPVAKPKEEPLLVKFLTDDPDVVIYWLIDPVQGEQAL